MPEECKDKFPYCVYIERNSEISAENEGLKNVIQKMEEELRVLKSDKKDLQDLIIKLNMRMYLGY